MKSSLVSAIVSGQQKNKTTSYRCFGLDNIFSTQYPKITSDNTNYYFHSKNFSSISKLDSNFNFLYRKYLTESENGGTAVEDIRISFDNNGNVYATTSSAFGSSVIKRYLLKLNSSGNIVWQKSIPGSSVSNLTHPQIDSNGDIYVIAQYNGSYDFQLYKFSPDGTLLLNKTYGLSNASFHPIAYKFILDSSNNIYVVGQRYSPIQGAIWKLDSSGNPQWFRYTPGQYQMVEVVIANNSLYTFGTGTDGFILSKFDLNGNIIKSIKLLENGSNASQAVSGTFLSRMTVLNNEYIIIPTRGPGGTSGYSAYLAKLDLNLNLVSQKEILVYAGHSPTISGCSIFNNKLIYQSQDATNFRYGFFATELDTSILNSENKIVRDNFVRANDSSTGTKIYGKFSIIDGTLLSITNFSPTINSDLSLTSATGTTSFSTSSLTESSLATDTSYSYRID
jgi:hypothetical protein